jgi:acetyl-CoA carboxylase biotin carboxyl carrier protein
LKLSDIEKLVKLLGESNLAEMEVQFNWREKVRLSKVGGQVRVEQAPAYNIPQIQETRDVRPEPNVEKTSETQSPKRAANLVAITSPMVGTFYRAPAPDAPPYVDTGDMVKPGTVVCIIEAMKLMNELQSDISGKVVEILVSNETPVEYGQELFLIEPM